MKKNLTNYLYIFVLTFSAAYIWKETFKMLFIYVPKGNHPVFKTTKLPNGNSMVSFILDSVNIMYCLVFLLTTVIIIISSYGLAKTLLKRNFDWSRILWFQSISFILVLLLMFFIMSSVGARVG